MEKVKTGSTFVTGIMFLLMIALLVAVYFQEPRNFVVETAECPYFSPNVTRNVIELDGWTCDAPEPRGDLLQPSGLWVLDRVECHKLEMTIDEYCETNDCSS